MLYMELELNEANQLRAIEIEAPNFLSDSQMSWWRQPIYNIPLWFRKVIMEEKDLPAYIEAVAIIRQCGGESKQEAGKLVHIDVLPLYCDYMTAEREINHTQINQQEFDQFNGDSELLDYSDADICLWLKSKIAENSRMSSPFAQDWQGIYKKYLSGYMADGICQAMPWDNEMFACPEYCIRPDRVGKFPTFRWLEINEPELIDRVFWATLDGTRGIIVSAEIVADDDLEFLTSAYKGDCIEKRMVDWAFFYETEQRGIQTTNKIYQYLMSEQYELCLHVSKKLGTGCACYHNLAGTVPMPGVFIPKDKITEEVLHKVAIEFAKNDQVNYKKLV